MPTKLSEKKPRRDEGSIDRQPDGRYLVRLQYRNAQGKRSSKKSLVIGHEKAKSKLAELRDDIARELSDRKTYRQVDVAYRKECVHPARFDSAGNKQSGFKQDLRIVKAYLDIGLNFFEDRYIDEIAFKDLQKFKETLVATPTKHDLKRAEKADKPVVVTRSMADVNQTLRRVRRIFTYAVEKDWLTKPPFKKGKGLISDTSETFRMWVLTPDEERRLIAECSGVREHLRPLVIFAIDTAARKNEIAAAKWFDVNSKGRSITVRNKSRNAESTRRTPLTERTEKELAQLRQNATPTVETIFNLGDFKKAWKGATKAAGVEGLHFHDLRHTGITRWLEHGVSITDAMNASGHKDMKTFMRYVNQHSDTMKSFAEKLDKAA